jgi:hypothetical protein
VPVPVSVDDHSASFGKRRVRGLVDAEQNSRRHWPDEVGVRERLLGQVLQPRREHEPEFAVAEQCAQVERVRSRRKPGEVDVARFGARSNARVRPWPYASRAVAYTDDVVFGSVFH